MAATELLLNFEMAGLDGSNPLDTSNATTDQGSEGWEFESLRAQASSLVRA